MKNILMAVVCSVSMLGSGLVMAGADTDKAKGGEMSCNGACAGAKTGAEKSSTEKTDKTGKADKDKTKGGDKSCGGDKGAKSGSTEKTAGGDNGCGK